MDFLLTHTLYCSITWLHQTEAGVDQPGPGLAHDDRLALPGLCGGGVGQTEVQLHRPVAGVVKPEAQRHRAVHQGEGGRLEEGQADVPRVGRQPLQLGGL